MGYIFTLIPGHSIHSDSVGDVFGHILMHAIMQIIEINLESVAHENN